MEQNDEIKEESKVNWLEDEVKNIPQSDGDFEKLPSVQFEEGKITTVRIDASNPFRKWEDQENGKTKAIIPCTTEIDKVWQKANWWLNIKNPVYKDVIHKCKDATNKAEVEVKIMQTGSKQNTKYNIVKE